MKLAGTPVERAEALAQIGWGTALTVGMTGMVFSMETTAAYPKDPGERKRWDEQRITPWSIKVGNRWYNYSRFGPLSVSVMLAAGYKQALLAGKDAEAKQFAYRLAGQYIQGPLQLPMVQSTAALLDALQDPENKFDKYLQTMATGLIPNILRDIRQQLDDRRRKPVGLVEGLKDMIPGLSMTVQPRVDALGHESKLELNPILRLTKMTAVSTSSDVTKALDETGYQPPIPNTTLTIHGKSVSLTGDEKTHFLKEMGKAAEDAIRTLVDSPAYQRMTPKLKVEALTRLVRRRQEMARERFKRMRGKTTMPASSASLPTEGTAQKLFSDLASMGGQIDEVTRTKIQEELTRDEGVRLAPYKDSLGNWTIGIGHLITSPDQMKKITRVEADALLGQDIAEAEERLRKFIEPSVLSATGGARRRALVNLSFNLGNKLGQFEHFLDAVNSEDWEGAADLLKGTNYAKQVGDRASRIQKMLSTGREG
jgi:lysozyme